MENQETEKPGKRKVGRPKGKLSAVNNDLNNILKLNAPYILERAVTLATSKPEKFQPLLMKLIDKITPNLNVNTNINVSSDFEGKLIDVLSRANQLREPQTVELIPETPCTLLNKEDDCSDKTVVYSEGVQVNSDNIDNELNKVFNKSEGVRGTSDGDGVCPNANG